MVGQFQAEERANDDGAAGRAMVRILNFSKHWNHEPAGVANRDSRISYEHRVEKVK
jgi:hypothetical protein